MKPFSSPTLQLGLPILLALGAGCSDVASKGDDEGRFDAGTVSPATAPPASAQPARGSPAANAARIPPELPNMADRDRDHTRIDDGLEMSVDPSGFASLEVILNRPATVDQLAAFARLGGTVRHVFVAVSYGWSGSLPRANLLRLRKELGSALHFIAGPREVVPLLDEATRTGRVRPVWAPSFAGAPLGFMGDPNTTIGVLDTGFDITHPDLSDNSLGFKDYSADAAMTPRDIEGHGTHVTAIAVGSGAAFGVGPGTLRFTNSGDLTGFNSGFFLPGPIHTPSYFIGSTSLSVSVSAVWNGGGAASLRAAQANDPAGTWAQFGMITGSSPQMVGAMSTSSAARYSDALTQTNPASITTFAVANSVIDYPAVGDGFNAMSGVAPKCKWFGAKVFTDKGSGSSAATGAAVDDLVASRVAKNIKILNLSLGSIGGSDAPLRAKVNSAVNSGVLVVVAAGNDGLKASVGDPGRAKKVLTVGASNDVNELTSYTSAGSTTLLDPDSDDFKPDLLAPGGSSYRSLILSADSNSADAESATFPDLQPNDYRGLQGTSMAAPFAAGAAALVIQAMEQAGLAWDFTSGTRALFVKMLLLASATETNKNREAGSGGNPILGRAAQPKDQYEGYGILNPDAAIEAVSNALPAAFTGTVDSGGPYRFEWERRAWGRRVLLRKNDTLALDLTMPASADFDLYLYAGNPDANGNPVIRASSVNSAVGGAESLSFTSPQDEIEYVMVKRVSGFGTFSLSGVHTVACGNGVIDPGEDCDPAMPGSAECCSDGCLVLTAGSACEDGNACTTADRCMAGKCVGGGAIKCAPIECRVSGGCDPDTGKCTVSAVFNDGAACSFGSCQSGVCLPDAPATQNAGGAAARGGEDGGGSGDDGAGGSGAGADPNAGAAGDSVLSSNRGGAAGEPAATTADEPASRGGTSTARAVDGGGGCGCSAARASTPAGSALSLAVLCLLAARRRRGSQAAVACSCNARP